MFSLHYLEDLMEYVLSASTYIMHDPYVYIPSFIIGIFFKKRLFLLCIWLVYIALSRNLDNYSIVAYAFTLMVITYIVAIISSIIRPKRFLPAQNTPGQSKTEIQTASQNKQNRATPSINARGALRNQQPSNEQKQHTTHVDSWDVLKGQPPVTSAPAKVTRTQTVKEQKNKQMPTTFVPNKPSFSGHKNDAFTNGIDADKDPSVYKPFQLERYQFDFATEEFDISDDNPDSTLGSVSVTAPFNLRQARASLRAKNKSLAAKANQRGGRSSVGSLSKRRHGFASGTEQIKTQNGTTDDTTDEFSNDLNFESYDFDKYTEHFCIEDDDFDHKDLSFYQK